MITETKYKNNKDLSEKLPQQWYKNFVKEQFNLVPEQKIGLEEQSESKDKSDNQLDLKSSNSSVNILEDEK